MTDRIEDKHGFIKPELTASGMIKCPDCGYDKFQEGPVGGMSQNIKCGKCGAEWNDCGPFGLERIGE